VNSKSHQDAKTGLISLMIFMSIFSTSLVQSANAFNIGLPDIPFFNFNFANISAQADSTSTIDFNASTKIIPKSSPDEEEDENVSDSKFETPDNISGEVQNGAEYSQSRSASLPFPSNMIGSVYSNGNEGSNNMDKVTSELPNTLPLIGNYADIPSAFLLDAESSNEIEIPGQYIVVFKDDDTTVSDFFSMASSKIDTRDIELLQVYENVLNGLAIRVPNDKVIEAIEQFPIVDYVEKDVMAQAFAQTLPSGIDRIDLDISFTNPGNNAGINDVGFATLDMGIGHNK
jgi:subtilisin